MCSTSPLNNNPEEGVKSPVEEMLRYIESLPQDPPKIKEEIRTRKFWTSIWSEFLATLLLTVVTSVAPNHNESDIRQSLAVGFSSALLTYTLHGVAFNPAVTLSRFLVRNASLLKFFASVFVQAAGAVIGSCLVLALTKDHKVQDIEGLNLSQIFGVEFLGSLVIVLTVLTSDDDVESGIIKFQAFPVGMAYASATLFSFSYTGVGLNPARALGPALLSNHWRNHWVYWIGPLLGGLIGGFTYDYARSSRKDVKERVDREQRRAIADTIKRDFSVLSQDTEMTNSINTGDCRV